MAYTNEETGAVNNVNLLMDNLHNFINNNTDFTVVDFSTYDTNGKRLILQKNGLYYNIYSMLKKDIYFGTTKTFDGIFSFMSDSYNLTNTFKQEVDASVQKEYRVTAFHDDIPFYGFYWNGQNFVLVAEYDNGFYSFLNFGKHTSFGNYDFEVLAANATRTGSTVDYYYEPLFADFLAYGDNTWFNNGSERVISQSQTSAPSFVSSQLLGDSWNELNGKSSLFYDVFFYDNTSLDDTYQPIAQNTDMAFCSAEFLNPQEVFNVGGKEFIFFPFYQKEDPIDYNNSKSKGMGIALRTL